MTASLPDLPHAGNHAFFFDFDGTLAELARAPDLVRVEARAKSALETLIAATGGAVAIVTGREIEAIDGFLSPLRLPVAGVHGFERRNHGATIFASTPDTDIIDAVETKLRTFASYNAGLLVERKRGALALHFRLRPELESLATAVMEEAVNRLADTVVTRGKMVIEARFHTANKGTAIHQFMKEAPFQGRIPLFAGDDVTDEDAFGVVNDLGGITVKVGDGATRARFRSGSVDEFLTWMSLTANNAGGILENGQP